MLANILSHFESIGDNCELGLYQRKHGIEYSNILKWSFSFSIDALCYAIETNFDEVFKYENLIPRAGGDMVDDLGSKIGFHSEMRSSFDGHSWRFILNEDERKKLYEQEVSKTKYLINKTINIIKSANKILVYKCNSNCTKAQEYRLLKAIRSIGPSHLLIVKQINNASLYGTVQVI